MAIFPSLEPLVTCKLNAVVFMQIKETYILSSQKSFLLFCFFFCIGLPAMCIDYSFSRRSLFSIVLKLGMQERPVFKKKLSCR